MSIDSKYRRMFLEATIGVLMVNMDGEIIETNPFTDALFGYEKGELIGKRLEILLPDHLKKKHVDHRTNFQERPKVRTMGANLDLAGKRKDGTLFPIAISLSFMTIDEEQYSLAFVSDDSKQKQMYAKIKEYKELIDESQRLAHMGSFEVDVKTGRYRWSKSMNLIFETDDNKEDLPGEEYLSYVHPEDREKFARFHEEIERKKEGINFGYRIITSKGDIKYVEGKRDVKLNANGEVVKIIGLLQDVTQLRDVKGKYKDTSKIIEDSLNEIFIFDAESLRFIQVNKGARDNIGYTLEEMQSMTPVDIKPDYDWDSFTSVLKKLKARKNSKIQFETRHQRKDGSMYDVEVHIQYSSLGDRPVYVAIILDITKRLEQEKAIREYSTQLEFKVAERTRELRESEEKLLTSLSKEKELGALKSRFVSMASHEFRTPLSTILSSASLIKRYTETEQQENRLKHVNRIESSVKNLTSILNDFLSLEKLESGKVRYKPFMVEVPGFIEQIIEEVKVSTTKERSILHVHHGELDANIDEYMVKNIIINLLSNAIKYSPDDTRVDIVTFVLDDVLKIVVIDSGMGIPEEDQKLMFTRFFRAHNVENIKGTGLGLTIVKRYLDLMGGDIFFVSKEGKGTEFTVTIPLHNTTNS